MNALAALLSGINNHFQIIWVDTSTRYSVPEIILYVYERQKSSLKLK